MLRLIGSFGLGVVFVVISPGLRRTITDGFDTTEREMMANSPWSFVAAGIGLLLIVMCWLRHANEPKQ